MDGMGEADAPGLTGLTGLTGLSGLSGLSGGPGGLLLQATAIWRDQVSRTSKAAVMRSREYDNRFTASRQFEDAVYQDERRKPLRCAPDCGSAGLAGLARVAGLLGSSGLAGPMDGCGLGGRGSALESRLMRAQFEVIEKSAPAPTLDADPLNQTVESFVQEVDPEVAFLEGTRRRG
jgi:hypothetical protein